MPSTATKPKLVGPLAVLSVFVVLYSAIIAQQLLFGFLVVAIVWVFYLLYVVIALLDRVATAVERLADQRE
jgi:hypothetical protein